MTAPAARAAVWDETVNGDTSNDRESPTLLVLEPGANSFTATTTMGGDYDYLRLDVPAGAALESLFLRDYATDNLGATYLWMEQGPAFTMPSGGVDRGNLLGYTRFSHIHENVGTNLLPEMGRAPSAAGFTPPLGAGSYTLWFESIGGSATYTFDVVVTPEPAGAFAVAAAGVLCLRRQPRCSSR